MIKVIAHIDVVEAYLKEVLEIQKAAVAPTLQEEGCLEYTLFQDLKDPCCLTFVETWASEKALEVHLKHPNMIEKGKKLEGKIAKKDIRVYQAV